MKKPYTYLPFLLMIIGSIHFGANRPIASSFWIAIIVVLAFFFSQKPSNYQKEIRIGSLGLALFTGIGHLLKAINILSENSRLNKDLVIEYSLIFIGACLFVFFEKDFIREKIFKSQPKN